MLLLIDNFDSFTYNLVDYFRQLNVHVQVVRNNISIENIEKDSVKGLILSPGPGTPEKAGYLMDYLGYFWDKVPVLGICLGHQAIGTYFGAQLIKARRPMHGKVSTIKIVQDNLFTGLPPEWNIVRYHSLIISQLPDNLKCIADSEGEIMAIKHNAKPVYGIQFHPEAALTENGLDLLRNWLHLNKLLQVELM